MIWIGPQSCIDCGAATKARSECSSLHSKAELRRAQASMTGTTLNLPIAIFHWRKE